MKIFYRPASSVRISLKNYRKAVEDFVAATPNAAASERQLHRCYDVLVNALNHDAINGPIETHLAMMLPEEIQIAETEKFISFERAVLSDFSGIPGKTGEIIVINGLRNFNGGARINSAEALLLIIANQHIKLIEETNKARHLERKEKKRRKKQILASCFYVLAGASAIVGNIFVLGGGIYLTASVGSGAGAVVKGSADLYTVV